MTTSVEIDDELTGRIENLAKAKQRPTNWVVQKAIEDYIAREEKRESFKQDALQAWQDYQQDGLHTTFAETHEWLARLASDDDNKAPPKCHK